MKNFKKLIKESYLGNPLNEEKKPTKLSTWYAVPGGSVYKVVVTFDDGSTEKFRSEDEAGKKYDLNGVEREESEFDVSESLNEIKSGDVVVYNHDDHTVMRIEDDELGKRIYIRPNEESAILGKRDTFWVKPTDIETKEEFMDRMMKDQIEHDEETLRRERGDLSKSSSLIGRQGTRNFMDEAEDKINEVVRGDDFQFIEIKDLHFETDPDRLEDMKIAFGAKMGGVTNREMIEDAEYELRRFRKEISFGDGSYSGVFLPGTYDAINSKLGDGPHAKKIPTPKWTDKKYEQWIEDVASGGGAEFAYDMAQNAKMEAGLIDWVKKNRLGFGDVTPLERIQYDIEALAESVNEAKTESELKDAWRKWNKNHPKDQIDWGEYREEHGEHLDEVTQKEIDDIENSGNIDIAYKKAMKLLNSLKEKPVNEGMEGKPQYYVKYTTQDGETAKSGFMSKREAIKKEEALVNSGVKKSAVWRIQKHVDLNGKPYTIDTELDKEIDYRKDEKGRPINEGTCGYTPDGKPRSKPASPELMKDDINLNIDSKGKESEDLDNEVNHMFEEDLTENKDEKLAIMLDENGKFIIGMATDKHARSKEAGPFNTQKEACKFYSDKKETLLKNLTENNRLDEFLSNKYQIVGDINSTCAINESKEFNFKKIIKEALTPNYLK